MSRLLLKRFTGTSSDPRGATVPSYANPVAIDGFVVPRSTKESNQAGYENRVIDELTLLGFTATIGPKDLVMVDGKEYSVEGSEFDYGSWNPLSNFGGKQVALKKVTG